MTEVKEINFDIKHVYDGNVKPDEINNIDYSDDDDDNDGDSSSSSDSDNNNNETPHSYSSLTEWRDVTPIAQYDMSKLKRVTCPIAYDKEYAEKKAYFRCLVAMVRRGEVKMSDPRIHEIAVDIIQDNPAEYTAWHYLRLYTSENALSLEAYRAELKFVDKIADATPKNYQLWVYRESILQNILARYPTTVDRTALATEELNWCAALIAQDSKNYHAWDYRQWVIRFFGHWKYELEYTEFLINSDLRNNSAWTHRFFVLVHSAETSKKDESNTTAGDNGGNGGSTPNLQAFFPKDLVEREIAFAAKYIRKAPASNQSAWMFLAGLVERSEHGMFADFPAVKSLCLEIEAACPKSAYCAAMLVDIFDEEGEEQARTERITRLIAELDPVRKNYWEYVLKTPKYPVAVDVAPKKKREEEEEEGK